MWGSSPNGRLIYFWSVMLLGAGWLKHQTMLINENRLNMVDARARQYLLKQAEKHFFEDGADMATGYVPPPPPQ